jgi:2-C-methyl-D-erythritol 2,4-cyclodiphosphate synthase
MLRIGNGYDVHAFTEGDFITLGGAKISHSKSLKAHSDGDVLIHALWDALLGALALGDIGHHFPDNDEKFKNIDSRVLLRQVSAIVNKKAYQLVNCDCTVVAELPKLAPYVMDMRINLAEELGVEVDAVSVKATTTETLGFTGREEGIAVYAVVLLERSS